MYNARLFLDLLLAVAALAAPLYSPAVEEAEAATATPAVVKHAAMPHAVKVKAKAPAARHLTYTVTATVYEAVSGQTDDEPFVTADNSRIKAHYGTAKRWMALSRDLLKPWGGKFAYGDKVRVQGISPKLDGVYTVHDTMNRRHRHCMDVLAHPSENLDIFTKGVKIQKVNNN